MAYLQPVTFSPVRPIYIGTQAAVGQSSLTTVVTMVADPADTRMVTHILCSGEESARWELYLDSVLIATKRTTDRNVMFDFGAPLEILATEVLDVKVIFYGPGITSDFDSTIYGYTP